MPQCNDYHGRYMFTVIEKDWNKWVDRAASPLDRLQIEYTAMQAWMNHSKYLPR